MVRSVQHGDEARRVHQHVGQLFAFGFEALVVGLDLGGPLKHLAADHGVQGGGRLCFSDLVTQAQQVGHIAGVLQDMGDLAGLILDRRVGAAPEPVVEDGRAVGTGDQDGIVQDGQVIRLPGAQHLVEGGA
ncbi:hypothetical protein D3C73_952030 [compost metagenome]